MIGAQSTWRKLAFVENQKFGRQVRVLRQRLGWRQADLALRCRISQATVSRLERGAIRGTSWDALQRVAVALGAELDMKLRWRGEELDRLLDAPHAAIVDRLVEILTPLGWLCAAEVTFWVNGEQGCVDLLAWHPATGRLLIVEAKSIVPDLQQMLSSLDRKVRLAGSIAARRGWRSNGVAKAIVMAGTATNRRRAERFGATLRTVLPSDGASMRRWVADPVGPCPAALWYLSDSRVMTTIRRRRVRTKPRDGRKAAVAEVLSVATPPRTPPPGDARARIGRRLDNSRPVTG
jgi:transcriptional regulator with XRE-family HTH domain